MTELYSPDELSLAFKKRKVIITLGIVLPAFFLVFSVFSCFVVNLESLAFFKIADSLLLVISAWISVYLLGNRRIKLNDKLSHLDRVINGKREVVSFRISEIGTAKTIFENIVAYEIFSDERDVAYYVEARLGALPFSVGDEIKIAIVNNFVVAYEVKK